MTKKTTGKFLIPRGDAFDLDFANYHFDDRFLKARELMNERRFTVGETDVAYRVVNHWDQSGLLPASVKGDGGWRKFTLPEMVWLKAIVRMRGFGLSLDKIAAAKDDIMKWDKKLEQYPYFEYYVLKAWFSSSNPYILVTSDGRAEVATTSEIEAAKLILGSFDVLLISLKAILQDMGVGTPKGKTLFALSDKEVELLSSIRLKNNNEIRAKIDDNGDITEIESTETISTPLASHKLKNQVEQEKMYGKVVTQYEDGIPKSIQVTKCKKMKS